MNDETENTIALPLTPFSGMSLRPSWCPSPAHLVLALCVAILAAVGPKLGSPSAVSMAAIFIASAASSIGGFAFSAICGAMLFHLVADPVLVLQMMMVCSIANQLAMTWSLRHDINDWREFSLCLMGGLVGLPIGVWAFVHADRQVYSEALGIFLLLYGIYMLFRRPSRRVIQHPALDVMAGFLGGITGGTVGFPSAALTICCGFKGWDKDRQRALFQPFILVMQIGGILAISLAARETGRGVGFEPHVAMCIPASLLGTAVGMAVFHRLSTQQFALSVNILLVVAGLSYLL